MRPTLPFGGQRDRSPRMPTYRSSLGRVIGLSGLQDMRGHTIHLRNHRRTFPHGGNNNTTVHWSMTFTSPALAIH